MYKYRVGVIAEGPTDISVIEAIVKSIFPQKVFVFYPISPSQEELSMQKKDEGFGWSGVYRICRNLGEKLKLVEEINGVFDCVIIHIDADVSHSSYADIGELNPCKDDLPCAENSEKSCEAACLSLEKVLNNWLNVNDERMVSCIPCICTETWVGCWLYPDQWGDIEESTDEERIYERLYRLGLPKSEKDKRLLRAKNKKFKKCTKGYIYAANNLSGELWKSVLVRYAQARKFNNNVSQLLSSSVEQ